LGEKNVVNEIISVEDISIGIFDLLGEPGHISVVVVGSPVETGSEIGKLSIKVIK
jgi:hypothetical protein